MLSFPVNRLSSLLLLTLLGDTAAALGVGEASVSSRLGAPLRATIPLQGASGLADGPLVIELAPAAALAAGSGTRGLWYHGLRFAPAIEGDRGVIHVSSAEPVTEPYLNFVLSVRWPTGSLLREYTLLIEAPVPFPATATSASTQLLQSAAAPRHGTGAPPPAAVVAFESALMTRPGDSLWRVANRLARPAGTTIQQAMNAIYQLNPQAFIAGDPNRMRALVPLHAPSAAQLAAAPRRFNPQPPAAGGTASELAQGPSASPSRAGALGATSDPTAAPPQPRQDEAVDDDLTDQLAGLKAGVLSVEAGKARARADIEELEQQLQQLISRYELMAARASTLEQLAARRSTASAPVTATTASAASAAMPPADASGGADIALLLSVVGGFGALGYAGGRRLPPPRRPYPQGRHATGAGSKARSWQRLLARLGQGAPKGSATYENPHRGPCAVTLQATGALSERELREEVLARPLQTGPRLKLLEIYAASGKRARFEGLAHSTLAQAPELTARIDELRRSGSFTPG